jgi:hypothetical protein
LIVDNTRRGAPILHGVTFAVLGSQNASKKRTVETILQLGGTVKKGNDGLRLATIIVAPLDVLLEILRGGEKKQDAQKVLLTRLKQVVSPRYVEECKARNDTTTKGRPDHSEFLLANDSLDVQRQINVLNQRDVAASGLRLGLSFVRQSIPNHLQ